METIEGDPDEDHISTSYVERQNLTMRMGMRRFTRLTNGHSKRFENHCRGVALHFMFYNFVRVHETLRVTPAMEIGITDHIWTIEELITEALATPEPTPAPFAPPAPEEAKPLSAYRAKRLPKPPGRPTHVPWLRIIDGDRAA